MITIEEPPAKPYCASCDQQLSWLWSPNKQAWVAFVACGCERYSVKPHGCRHAQDPRTWRQIEHGDPPSVEYIEMKNKIASKETT